MFDGVALSCLFDGEGMPPDTDLPHERLDLLTGNTSFSLHFDPGFPCEFASSATLTVPLECPSPSADVFVVAPIWTWTEPQAEIAFPSGKASLSGAFDETASRAYVADRGFIGQAPRGVATRGRLPASLTDDAFVVRGLDPTNTMLNSITRY